MTSSNYYFDYSYQMKNICNQSRGRQIFNIPSTRSELRESPYEQYTKQQVDMRRKVEILKYNSNRMSTQTNSLTKSQKWKNLISGITPSASSTITSETETCSEYKTLSSSCNIPGPVFEIYEDKNVPLYNFKEKQSIFSIYPDQPLIKWSNKTRNNVDISTKTDEIINTIITRVPSENLKYNYNISIPIAFNTKFFIKNTSYSNIISEDDFNIYDIKLKLNSVELRVYYNDDIISKYNIVNDLINHEINYGIRIKKGSDVNNYELLCFVGNITFDNLLLYNKNQYVYDIKLYVDYSLIFDSNLLSINQSNIIGNYVSTDVTIYKIQILVDGELITYYTNTTYILFPKSEDFGLILNPLDIVEYEYFSLTAE